MRSRARLPFRDKQRRDLGGRAASDLADRPRAAEKSLTADSMADQTSPEAGSLFREHDARRPHAAAAGPNQSACGPNGMAESRLCNLRGILRVKRAQFGAGRRISNQTGIALAGGYLLVHCNPPKADH